MELVIDSASLEAIRELDELLNISGVTTNPTIITKTGKDPEEVIGELCDFLTESQSLFIQAIRTDCEGMVEEARWIASLREANTYVKIPVTREGLKAIKICKDLGIGVLATAIYSADQAFLAAANGADYLAPYVNRMDNYGDGVENVKDLLQMLKVNDMRARVIAASFKNTRQVHELIKAGVHAVTIPPEVAFAMIDHPGTEIAVREFGDSWFRAYGRDSLL